MIYGVVRNEALFHAHYAIAAGAVETQRAAAAVQGDSSPVMERMRRFDDWSQAIEGDIPQAGEGVLKELFLEADLGFVIDVLPLAASAISEVRTGRGAAERGRLHHVDKPAPVQPLLRPHDLERDSFARYDVRDKNFFALARSYSETAKGEIFNIDYFVHTAQNRPRDAARFFHCQKAFLFPLCGV